MPFVELCIFQQMHRGVGWQGEKDCERLISRIISRKITKGMVLAMGAITVPMLLPTVFSAAANIFSQSKRRPHSSDQPSHSGGSSQLWRAVRRRQDPRVRSRGESS